MTSKKQQPSSMKQELSLLLAAKQLQLLSRTDKTSPAQNVKAIMASRIGGTKMLSINTKPNVPAAEQKTWQECCNLASGPVGDNTRGATNFQKASYGKGYRNTAKIGAHYFAV